MCKMSLKSKRNVVNRFLRLNNERKDQTNQKKNREGIAKALKVTNVLIFLSNKFGEVSKTTQTVLNTV